LTALRTSTDGPGSAANVEDIAAAFTLVLADQFRVVVLGFGGGLRRHGQTLADGWVVVK
jgi:hypothetical protein